TVRSVELESKTWMSSDHATESRQPGRSCSSLSVRMRTETFEGWLVEFTARALAKRLRWITGVDRPWLEIARRYRTKAEDCTFSDPDSRGDRGAGADPGVWFNRHGVGKQREGRIVVIMR